jgi:hypothetical protein
MLYYDKSKTNTIVYSISRFPIYALDYPLNDFPHMTTAPSNIEENFFYSSNIIHLSCNTNSILTPVSHRFNQVKRLELSGSSLLSLDILSSIVNLKKIQYLEIADIDRLSSDELKNLLAHIPHVNYLHMKFDPLFIIPSQIRRRSLSDPGRSISLDRLSQTISSVKRLEMSMASKQMIIDVIDHFHDLDNLDIYFDDGDLDDDCMSICKGVSID